MNLPTFSIKRPITVIMLVALMASIGLVSMTSSTTDLMPDITMPMVAIVTSYSGAGAREVETLISRPIERALGSVGGVESISSDSAEGLSIVSAELGWGVDLDSAIMDVRDAVDLIRPYLPEDADNPRIIKADLSMMPLMRLVVSGPHLPLDLTRTADEVRKRLERIEGVASVNVGGGTYEEIRVEVNPSLLLMHGLTVPQIAAVLRTENLSLPGGHLEEAGRRMVLRTQGDFKSVADVAGVILTTPLGAKVRLDDIASVELLAVESEDVSRINGDPAVTLSVRKQSGSNTVQIAEAVHAAVSDMQRELPQDVQVRVIQDQSEFIGRALGQMTDSILTGGLLAVLILYLFLCEVRTVAVIALAIPVSVMATFAFMYFSGMTLNLVSLGGVALGVGMLVDNSIVILENIYRHKQLGSEPREAAARGAQEVAMAITASTATTVAVFVPVVFVKGLASQLFGQLALTVSFSLGSSLLVALTFVPMAAAVLLRTPESGAPKGRMAAFNARLAAASFKVQQRLDSAYRSLVTKALNRRGLVIGIVAMLLLLTGVGYLNTSRNLLPQMDQREISIEVRLERGSSSDWADHILQQVEVLVLGRTDVEYAFASTGGGIKMRFGLSGSDVAEVLAKLKPRERGMGSTEQVMLDLRRDLALIAGADCLVSSSSGFFGGEAAFGAPLVASVRGEDLSLLVSLGEGIADVMREVPGVVNVETTLAEASPEVQIVVDRQRAAAAGLGTAQVATLVRSAVEGQFATTARLEDEDVDVRVIFPVDSRRRVEDILSMLLPSASGGVVRLNEIAAITFEAGPTSIVRMDGSRLAQVQASLSGVDLDTAMSRVEEALSGFAIPPGYSLELGGQTQEIGSAFGSLGQSLIMSLILVYAVMAAQFESMRHPLIIMITVPIALAGAVLAMILFGLDLSIPAIVGVIALAGVAVNNGIVLVDYANQLRAQGMDLQRALVEAGSVRMRPILMTSLTTISALLPMVIATGEGNEMQRSMAAPLLGGLAVSTVLTLFVVPVLYSLITAQRAHSAGAAAGARTGATAVEVSK